MGRSLLRAIFLGSVTSAFVACNAITGLGDLVTEPDAPDASEASVAPLPTTTGTVPAPGLDAGRDGGSLGTVDAEVVDGCSTTSCEALPLGFQLVAIGPRNDACPNGFGQPLDAVEEPAVGAGACTCGCDLKQAPSCTVGGGATITLGYGAVGSGTCAMAGQDVPTGCSTAGFMGPFLPYERSYTAPLATLTGGACDVKVVTDDTKLSTKSLRVCQATVLPQCEGKTCPPALTGFTACIAATGDVACPAAWPTKHLVGTSASFTCSAGCSCTVGGQCSTTGTLKYYPTANCTGGADLTYPVGGCGATPGSGATVYGSHRYDPAGPSSTRCNTGGISTPSAPSLAQPSTVCCR